MDRKGILRKTSPTRRQKSMTSFGIERKNSISHKFDQNKANGNGYLENNGENKLKYTSPKLHSIRKIEKKLENTKENKISNKNIDARFADLEHLESKKVSGDDVFLFVSTFFVCIINSTVTAEIITVCLIF